MKSMIVGGAIVLMAALLAAPAAVQAQDIQDYDYETNADNTITITGYTGTNELVTIPAEITGLPVRSIAEDAFSSQTITSVSIPDGVTDIGVGAFVDCGYLTNATIAGSVTSIGGYAFWVCHDLTTVTIASGLLSIGNEAFGYCTSLTSVTIPGSVINIGDSAFENCTSLTNVTFGNGVTCTGEGSFYECTSLTSVTIPASVTNIGESFTVCTGLTAITVDTNNPAYSSLDGVLLDKSEARLIQFPCGKAGSYTIPGSVTCIAGYAFYYCTNLASVMIPGSVTNIEAQAFSECLNLTSVYFQGNDPFSLTGLTGPPLRPSVTVYYLPGTTGWADFSIATGLPAVLWNPLIQTGDGSFGVQNGQFGFNITGTTNIPIVVEASTSLAGPVWTPLQSLTLTNGSYYFSEPFQPGSPGRFYRITSQ